MVRAEKSRVDGVLQGLASLSEEELAVLRRRLEADPRLRTLLGGLRGDVKKHSVLELRGLGKEYWRSIDVDAYIAEERASWGS